MMDESKGTSIKEVINMTALPMGDARRLIVRGRILAWWRDGDQSRRQSRQE